MVAVSVSEKESENQRIQFQVRYEIQPGFPYRQERLLSITENVANLIQFITKVLIIEMDYSEKMKRWKLMLLWRKGVAVGKLNSVVKVFATGLVVEMDDISMVLMGLWETFLMP